MFNPPINLVEEGKWMIAVTSSDGTNAIFDITDEKNSFSISIPGYLSAWGGQETNDKLQEFSKFRARNDIELHVEEIRKKGYQIKIGSKN